jgi:two-component system sensor histidine kinase TorS
MEDARALHLLLVDPLAGQAAIARGMLAAQGHRVTVAQDWRTAETLLGLHAFDAVAMAVDTPGPQGAPAVQALRGGPARSSGIPVLGLGVGVHRRDGAAALADGFDALLPRPFTAEAMAAALAEARRRRAPPPLLDPAQRDALRQSHGPAALAALDEAAIARAAAAIAPLMTEAASRAETQAAIETLAESMEAVGAAALAAEARRMIAGGPRAMRGILPLLQAIVAARFALRADRMTAASADPIWAASDISPGESP